MKRMEAEVLNDTLLLISGRLDETRFGVPQPVIVRGDGLVTPIETEKGWRRSIYVAQRRTELPTLMENFDLPAMNPNCLERSVSTVAPQALNLLNNALIHRLAHSLAERVQREAGSEPQRQIEKVYWIAFSRPPSEEEKKVSLEALSRLTQDETRSLPVKGVEDPRVAALTARPAPAGAEPGASDLTSATGEEPGLTALWKLCHTLVNSAAFMYID